MHRVTDPRPERPSSAGSWLAKANKADRTPIQPPGWAPPFRRPAEGPFVPDVMARVR